MAGSTFGQVAVPCVLLSLLSVLGCTFPCFAFGSTKKSETYHRMRNLFLVCVTFEKHSCRQAGPKAKAVF